MPEEMLRKYFERRRKAMEQERQSFIPQYQELSDFIKPRRGRFLISDRNKGDRRWSNIINSRATQALRISTAGLFNGVMSPTRPWFWLGTDDADRNEFGPHKQWLWALQEELRRDFIRSNLYNSVPSMISELLLFGTGCQSHLDDAKHLFRFYTHTVGSYSISQDERGTVKTVAREYEMTVEQIIGEFSVNPREINMNISATVRNQYDKGNYDTWFPVVQFVDPNPRVGMPRREDPEYKGWPFRSTYYEPSNDIDKGALLSQKGFKEFPFYVPRWELTGEDIYATESPGMVALGDVRGLQLEERRKAQAIDKMVSPPLHGPPSLRNVSIGSLPGSSTIYDAQGTQGLRPVYEVRPQVGELMADIERVEQRINDAFHVELFQAISAMQGVQPRNELELMQRHQERLLQLGPMLERFHNEYLDLLIDRALEQKFRSGQFPPPPEGLSGRPLKATYISTLAMAQQATTTGNIDRMIAFIGGLAATGHPDYVRAADKFDPDQAVDEYASLIGSPPQLIRSDDQVAEKRQLEDQQAAQQQQLEQAATMADAGAKLGSIKGDSVGGKLLDEARNAQEGNE